MSIQINMPAARSFVKYSLVLVIFLIVAVDKAAAQNNVTNQFQVLAKVAFMGKLVASELTRISTNEAVVLDLRKYAASVLTNHDVSGTNAYETLESFIGKWSITNEPAVSSNLITTMKQTLEYGVSARVQFEAYQANTNNPISLRKCAERFLHSLRGDD